MTGMSCVTRMILRGEWRGKKHEREDDNAHHASPGAGKGRTVTTCIMPACMW
ncbi:hypothetical protein SAMN04488060_1923 [Qipengyuania nanhaisediminis]|uniref:Uncharacterized protein n=1 Tax=Qipengyuania nanhaisediminis TaxID=604088 RepID=A0A1I5NKW2_9SPHN|nr:hypothetical protein SAMN04488060_1923 [Qipengyuania nanhaisediminis]